MTGRLTRTSSTRREKGSQTATVVTHRSGSLRNFVGEFKGYTTMRTTRVQICQFVKSTESRKVVIGSPLNRYSPMRKKGGKKLDRGLLIEMVDATDVRGSKMPWVVKNNRVRMQTKAMENGMSLLVAWAWRQDLVEVSTDATLLCTREPWQEIKGRHETGTRHESRLATTSVEERGGDDHRVQPWCWFYGKRASKESQTHININQQIRYDDMLTLIIDIIESTKSFDAISNSTECRGGAIIYCESKWRWVSVKLSTFVVSPFKA